MIKKNKKIECLDPLLITYGYKWARFPTNRRLRDSLGMTCQSTRNLRDSGRSHDSET